MAHHYADEAYMNGTPFSSYKKKHTGKRLECNADLSDYTFGGLEFTVLPPNRAHGTLFLSGKETYSPPMEAGETWPVFGLHWLDEGTALKFYNFKCQKVTVHIDEQMLGCTYKIQFKARKFKHEVTS